MSTSKQGENLNIRCRVSQDEVLQDMAPKKKPRKVQRQKLNGAIRHNWMARWFINIVNIDELDEAYCTPGSLMGFLSFVQLLMDKAKETMLELAAYFGETGSNVNNAHKDDGTLQEMCKQCALNWKREWNLWKNSMEKKEWLKSEEGAFLWGKFTSTDISWETKREKLAGEMERWFTIVIASKGKVVIQKDKHYMLDEPITEPCLTCVHMYDLDSSWDDSSRIRQDSQHDYHLVRFSPKHFVKFYGESMVYVAKRFRNLDFERQILAQHRMFMEIQISGIRMCGLINPVAMINEEEQPTLVFPYWNGGTLEDMLHNMKTFHDQVQLGKLDAPDHKLHMFMEKRLEISLALLETLRCLHSKGWIHNNLHANNILLHFPAWQWTKQGEPKLTGSTDLVFVGISNFGKACKAKHADLEWSSKFQEWDWEKSPNGPPRHIAPELFQTSDVDHSRLKGMRPYTKMSDMYALGTSLKKMCTGYFAGWDYRKYTEWHSRLNHTEEFRKRTGVERRLLHLLHRMTHPDAKLRLTAKMNTRQWIEDIGVDSSSVYRPLFGWSV